MGTTKNVNSLIKGEEFIEPGDLKKITRYEWEMYIKKRRMTINLRNAAQELLNEKIPTTDDMEQKQEENKNTAVEILVGLCLLEIEKSKLGEEACGSQKDTSTKSGWFEKSKQWLQKVLRSKNEDKKNGSEKSYAYKRKELIEQWEMLGKSNNDEKSKLDEIYTKNNLLAWEKDYKLKTKNINDNNIINIIPDDKVYKSIKDKSSTVPSDQGNTTSTPSTENNVDTKNENEKAEYFSIPDNLWGLALPGGGIRSATFVLGVMQGLMQKSSLFPKGAFRYFDYMSSVSGGGYMGACLSSLLTVTDNDDTLQKNKAHFGVEPDNSPFVDDKEPSAYLDPPNPKDPHQPIQFSKRDQLHHLRSHASYLSTDAGALSAAKQRMFGSVAAGMVHNLVVFAALFIALVASLHLSLSFFDRTSILAFDPHASGKSSDSTLTPSQDSLKSYLSPLWDSIKAKVQGVCKQSPSSDSTNQPHDLPFPFDITKSIDARQFVDSIYQQNNPRASTSASIVSCSKDSAASAVLHQQNNPKASTSANIVSCSKDSAASAALHQQNNPKVSTSASIVSCGKDSASAAASIEDKHQLIQKTIQPMYDFCPVWARDSMKNVFVWFGEIRLQVDRLYGSENNCIYFITFGVGALWVLIWVMIAHNMRKNVLEKIADTQKLKPGDTVIDDIESKLVTRFNSTSIVAVLLICVGARLIRFESLDAVSLLLCPLFFALGAYLTLLLLTHPRESFVSQNGIVVRSFYDILKGGALYGLIGSIAIPIGLILAASTNSLALALLSPVTLGLAAYIVFFGQVKNLQRSYKLLLNVFVGFSLAFLLTPTSAILLDLYQYYHCHDSNIKSLQGVFVQFLFRYFLELKENKFLTDWTYLYTIAAIFFQICAYIFHTIPQNKGREVRMKIQGWLHTLTIFFGFIALLLSKTAPIVLTITFLIFGIVHCFKRYRNKIISRSRAIFYIVMALAAIWAVWIIWNSVPDNTFFPPIYTIILSGIDIALLLTIFVDSNRTAPHYFYRDRLTEAFLRTEARVERANFKDKQGAALFMVRNDEDLNLKDLGENTLYNTYHAPYHIINAAINLGGSDELVRKSYKSDHFLFSKYYVGSSVTGYVPTKRYGTHEQGIRLAKVMTIAGAAAGSGMGIYTFLGQRFLMTLFNIRLGQWIENPWWYHKLDPKANIVPVNTSAERLIESKWTFWLYYLVREIMGWTNARERLVNVSDGGHTGDNLGMLALLHRRCRVVVVVDSEKDEKYAFGSFNNAVRLALVEQNININIDLTPLIPNWNKKSDNKLNMSRRSVAVGTIHYPKRQGDTEEFVGTLIYLRASVSEWDIGKFLGKKELEELLQMIRDDVYPKSTHTLSGSRFRSSADNDWNLPAHVENYNRTHEDFPNQSTLNQFYDTEEFEAYRALGEHVAKQAYPILYEIAQH